MDEIDRLMAGEHLALWGDIISNEDAIFSAVSRFAREKEKAAATWRIVILSNNHRSRTLPFFQKFMRESDLPKGKNSQSYFSTAYGRIYCSPIDLHFVWGIESTNTLWVVLDTQDTSVWDHIASTVHSALVVAVNPPYKRLYMFPSEKQEEPKW